MLNVVVIEGRATKDPELAKTSNGRSIANVTIAIDTIQSRKGMGKPIYLPVKFFGTVADNACKIVKKGNAITVIGKLEAYETDKGQTLFLNASDFQFPMTNKSDNQKPASDTLSTPVYQEKTSEQSFSGIDGIDIVGDDLPF